jgi:hypothetical protein
MRFRVRWEGTALNELATLWTQVSSGMRRLITRASHQIDRQLQGDPFGSSESRPGGRRILFLPPLGTLFRVEADGQTVSVLRVWIYRKRGQP